LKQSAPFIYILNDWYNYGYVARILTPRVMLSVSEASEKEILHCVLRIIIEKILHCVQNDREDKPKNDKAGEGSQRQMKVKRCRARVMLSVSEASEKKRFFTAFRMT